MIDLLSPLRNTNEKSWLKKNGPILQKVKRFSSGDYLLMLKGFFRLPSNAQLDDGGIIQIAGRCKRVS